MLTPEGVRQFSLLLLIALPFLRILTTSLSIGSGGSGGIFGPGMVIGAAVGGVSWRLFQGMPGFPDEPGPVVIICMIAAFGSIAHAPLAMLLMVGEMTGNLSLLAPAMVAVAVATLVVGDTTIYENQVDTRADSPAHRHRFAFPPLSALPAGRAAVSVSRWPAGTPSHSLPRLPIQVRPSSLMRRANSWANSAASAWMRPPGTTRRAKSVRSPSRSRASWGHMLLDEALDLLARTERRWLPVVDLETRKPVGIIDAAALVRSHREASRAGVRKAVGPIGHAGMFELPLRQRSPIAGKRVRDAELPAGVRIVTLDRDTVLFAPDGDTVLQAGDVLTIWCADGATGRAMEALLPV